MPVLKVCQGRLQPALGGWLGLSRCSVSPWGDLWVLPSPLVATHASPRYTSKHPTDTLELLHKRSDLLKHRLFLGQVLWVQRAHLGQHGVQLSTAV